MAYLMGWPSWRGRVIEDAPQAFLLSLGLKSHDGLILGAGTSSDPVATAVAGQKVASFYTKSTGTSDDSRGLYWRHYLAGVAGSGEALRAYTTISDVAAVNAHGAHISLDFADTGSASGEGYALKSTLHVPNGAMAGGNYSPLEAEIWCDGSSSDPSGVTQLHFLRIAATGNTTGVARVEDKAALFYLDGFTSASGNVWYDSTLRINCNGTTKYLVLSSAEDSLTLSGALVVSDATETSSGSTGAINTLGGLGVTKKLYVGTDVIMGGGDIDMSAGATGTYDIILKDSVADALSIRRSTTDMMVFDSSTPKITITPATDIVGALTLTSTLTVGANAAGADATFYSAVTAYKVWWDANGDTNGAWYFGADTKGVQVNLYGDITGCGVFWDPSTDTNGTLSVGASGGSKGNDFIAYGATNGNYLQWDQSADDLLLVGTATQLSVAGTAASSSTTTGSLRTAGGLGVAGAAFIGGAVNMMDDMELTLGTTVSTAATKITMAFDNATTGIGISTMGSVSVPMVLKSAPGATVISDTINILHSAGSGNCDDLIGRYTKVAVSGSGDSGTTLVADAPRAYVLAGAAKEVYASQPWAKHVGTGTVTAMSALSAMLLLNDAEAFTATNSINAGHFHISTVSGAANGTVTSSNFDGVMIEIYPNVTGMASALHIVNETSAGVTNAIEIDGGAYFTNVLNIDSTTGCVITTYTGNSAFVPNSKGTFTQCGQIKVKIGGSDYLIPFGTVA